MSQVKTANNVPEAAGAVSVRALADRLGVREATLLHWCRKGRVIGAFKHPLTKKWWVFPPARIVRP